MLKMNTDNWTLTEFKAYLLLFAAHSNFVETATERDYILSKIDSKIVDNMYHQVINDTSSKRLQRIQDYIQYQNFSEQEKQILIRDLKNVFFADGSVDIFEKNVFSQLYKILK